MYYVLLAEHPPNVCPTSNSKTREHLSKSGPEIPKIAERHGVKIIAGPYVSHEHISTLVVESSKAESIHQFVTDSGLAQWNTVRIIPSQTMADGMGDVERSKPIF